MAWNPDVYKRQLYDGAQLAAACQWAETNPTSVSATVRAFLDAATAEEEREAAEREQAQQEKLEQAQRLAEEATAREQAQTRAARTFKRAVVVAGILAGIAGLVAVFAFLQRNAAVVALNDSNARLLLNQSASLFERDPLLANRLLLEAAAVAGSEDGAAETTAALVDKLLTGRATQPITASVTAFTSYLTGTVHVVDYQLGNDGLMVGRTGAAVEPLSGDVTNICLLYTSTSMMW